MRSKYRIVVLSCFAFVLFGTALALPPQQAQMTITDGPRIEDVSDHSAEIAWTTSTGGSSVVHYGTDPNNLSQTAQASYAQSGTGSGQHGMHRVRIGNLQPNTTYYFVVDSGQGQGSGGEARSQVGQFTTAGSGGSDKVPLYRANLGDRHLFTPSYQEIKTAVNNGYRDEGVAAYVQRKQTAGTEPLFRLHVGSGDERFYTANPQERQTVLANGAQDEGVVGYIDTTQQPGTVPLYRMQAGDHHFYTTDPTERQRVLQQGWKDEGIVGYVWQH